MNRSNLPWILLGILAAAWAATSLLGSHDGASNEPTSGKCYTPAEWEAMEQLVANLKAELAQREIAPAPASHVVIPKPAPQEARPTPTRQAPVASPGDASNLQLRRLAYAQSKGWMDAMRSLEDRPAAARARLDALNALESSDLVELLAGLVTARWIELPVEERAAVRRRIERHLDHPRALVARAALEAATAVQPMAADAERWIALAYGDLRRGEAEGVTQMLVKATGGKIEGRAAEAILHLLRDGANIKKAFVMRGMQSFKTMDARVEDRLLDIVASVEPHDYDSAYYFHFLAPRFDPKSDRLVDLILETAGRGKSDIVRLMRTLRRGLSERQRKRAADKVMDYAKNASNRHTLHGLLMGMRVLADRSHMDDLRALAQADVADKAIVALIDEIVASLTDR